MPLTMEEARKRIREIGEKNRKKAPAGSGLWPPAPLFEAAYEPPPKPFSELAEREPGEDDDREEAL